MQFKNLKYHWQLESGITFYWRRIRNPQQSRIQDFWIPFHGAKSIWPVEESKVQRYCIIEVSVSITRDLTIRQRRRQWKRRWKNRLRVLWNFCRYTKSPSQLNVRRKVRLQLKRWNRFWVQREMVKFIALPFPFSTQLKLWSFHVVVVRARDGKEMYTKALCTCRVVVLLIKATFWRCRGRRSFVGSLLVHCWVAQFTAHRVWWTFTATIVHHSSIRLWIFELQLLW